MQAGPERSPAAPGPHWFRDGTGIEAKVKRNFLHALAAVLAGNAIYFVLLMPRLPLWAQHGIGKLDPGLGLDFLLCGAIFLLLRRWDRTRKATVYRPR